MPPPQMPLQQSVGPPQGWPSGEHVVAPHVPWTLQPLQQGVFGSQNRPSGRQVCGPQKPLKQSLLQQGTLGSQGAPSGLQTGAPQMPLGPHVPLQHEAALLHGPPSGWQLGCAHTPFWQNVEQHCAGLAQAVPRGAHAPPQKPALQIPSQQSVDALQLAPAGKQVGAPPVPTPPVPPLPPAAGRP